jgi:hypothetical protein
MAARLEDWNYSTQQHDVKNVNPSRTPCNMENFSPFVIIAFVFINK